MLRPLALVKYISGYIEQFNGITFIYFGDIPNMIGHSYCQDVKTGKPYILHTDNLVELTEDEV